VADGLIESIPPSPEQGEYRYMMLVAMVGIFMVLGLIAYTLMTGPQRNTGYWEHK